MLFRTHARLPFLVLLSALLMASAAAPALAAGAQRVEVTWQPVDRELAFSGHLAEGETRTVTVDARGMNLTSVTAELAWSETGEPEAGGAAGGDSDGDASDPMGVSGPDRFRLVGERPGGERMLGSPAAGDGGSLRVEAPQVNPVPVPFEVETADEAEARDAADAAAPMGGEGVWTFGVTLEDTGNPDGTQVDGGNRYTLTVTMQGVEANLMRVVGLDDGATSGAGGDLAPPPDSGAWRWMAGGLAVVASSLGAVLLREGTRRG